MKKEIVGTILSASVKEDGSGINLEIQDNSTGKKAFVFQETDQWGKISVGKNAKRELTKIAQSLNGYVELPNGDWEKVKDFKNRTVCIIVEDQ